MPNFGISLASDPKAVSKFETRKVAPSKLTSAQWSQIAPAIREKAFFSARVNNAELLGKMRDLIVQSVDTAKRDPKAAIMSQDKFISEIKDFMRSRGYSMGGTKLTDITSRKRLGLIYQMNVDEAREYGRYVRGQDSDILNAYPAQELLRVEYRLVPRNWQMRWQAAGGKIYGGRMVALKSDQVWTNISRFGRPYPPFDFGSGMGVEDVDRNEAIELGLLPKDDDEPSDEIPEFDVVMETEVSLDRIPEYLRETIIKETPNAEVRGDKLVMRDHKPLPTWKDLGLDSARLWKSSKPSIKENLIEVAEAKKQLKSGFTVKTPIGEAKFNESVLQHWEETLKRSDDIFGRLQRITVAEGCVREALEIWRLPNGQLMYINTFENASGKIKGIAVAVSDNTVVRTWFVSKIQGLDKCRKGELIYKR